MFKSDERNNRHVISSADTISKKVILIFTFKFEIKKGFYNRKFIIKTHETRIEAIVAYVNRELREKI